MLNLGVYCSAPHCLTRVVQGRAFCDSCWKQIPWITRERLIDAFDPETTLQAPTFFATLKRACKKLS